MTLASPCLPPQGFKTLHCAAVGSRADPHKGLDSALYTEPEVFSLLFTYSANLTLVISARSLKISARETGSHGMCVSRKGTVRSGVRQSWEKKEGGGRLEAVDALGRPKDREWMRTGGIWERTDPNPRPGLRTPQLPCFPDLISLISQGTHIPVHRARAPGLLLLCAVSLSHYLSSLHLSVSVSSLSGPCPGRPVNGHPGIPPWLQKQDSVGRREGWGRG